MTTDHFLIRTATAVDIPALERLIESSIRVLQKDDYSLAQIEGALGHALGLDTQLVEDQTYFVACPRDQPDQLAGCGGWSYRKTLYGSDHGPQRSVTLLDPERDHAKVRAIFVHPDWARRGLGSLILKHCEDAASSAGFTKFEMGSTLTGVPLYTLRGYRAEGTIAISLPNGATSPVVHMVKGAC